MPGSKRKRKQPRVTERIETEVAVPEPVTEVITEKTAIRIEPEVEIRKPATLAQALTEPAIAVVKPKTKVRREVTSRTRRAG